MPDAALPRRISCAEWNGRINGQARTSAFIPRGVGHCRHQVE
jgi:hypothetical protein